MVLHCLLNCELLILLKMLDWLLKALLKITSNITDNTVSRSRAIAYKCPILADLREHIGHKKTFP